MTLNGHFALCFKIHAFSEPITKIWTKIDPYSQRQRFSAMTNGNIRFMRIFARVPWRQVVKRQRGNRKHRFSGFRTLRTLNQDRRLWDTKRAFAGLDTGWLEGEGRKFEENGWPQIRFSTFALYKYSIDDWLTIDCVCASVSTKRRWQ